MREEQLQHETGPHTAGDLKGFTSTLT